MAYLIIGIPLVMITLLIMDVVAEKIARFRLRKKIADTRRNASSAIQAAFSILH